MYTYVCVYVCVYECVYVCIYLYIYIQILVMTFPLAGAQCRATPYVCIYIGLRLHSRPGQISLYLYIHILVMTFPLVGARSRATPHKVPSSPQEAIPPANRKKVNEETFCQREFILF